MTAKRRNKRAQFKMMALSAERVCDLKNKETSNCIALDKPCEECELCAALQKAYKYGIHSATPVAY